MSSRMAFVFACTLLLSALMTGIVRRLALSHGVLDVPNERSSHSKATPRGGGASVVVVVAAASMLLALSGALRSDLLIALLGGGAAVAAVGFLDDRFTVPARVRLAVHLGAAIWAVLWLGGLPPLRIGERIVQLGWPGDALAVVGIVWTLNLFNFMDGIDGLAGSEAVFVACAGSLLSLSGSGSNTVAPEGFAFSGACCGFLLWNWPPAKIFLGDVGSGFMGYAIALLGLAAIRRDPGALWVWLILGATFLVDATVTLLRRTLRGERVHEAHRSHAYQWLARRWGSHRRVTLLFIALNLFWLLPCATLATSYPARGPWITVGAMAPLVALALVAGSGRRETPTL